MTIAVIGAGIVGSSSAFHLASSGQDVVLVDGADLGSATEAGAGIVCPWLRTSEHEQLRRLKFAAANYYPDLIGLLAGVGQENTGFEVVGGLAVGGSHEDWPDIAAGVIRHRDEGQESIGEVRVLEVGEPQAMFSPLRNDLAGVYVQGAGRVNGSLIRDSLRAGALALGARLVTGKVTLQQRKGEVLVDVDGERLGADSAILAAGAWSAELAGQIGAVVPVVPERGQIVHLELPGIDTSQVPIVVPTGIFNYMLAFPASRILIGATRELGAGFDYRVTAEGLAEVLTEGLRLAPGLATATVVETRVGFRPVTRDGVPVFGAVPGTKNMVVATGTGPYGLTVGPYLGRLAAELVLGFQPDLDLSRLLSDRKL
jgi:D-amino-acid dehydrogenase